jgi:hypothetical protein
MRTDHAAMRRCHACALGRVGLNIMKPVLLAGFLIVSLPLTSMTATAHVKWFVDCNVSDDPLPVQAVLTATFLLFFTLFLILLYLGCVAERTALGANISQRLDRYAAPLHRRADDLLRSWRLSLLRCYGPTADSSSPRSSKRAASGCQQFSC